MPRPLYRSELVGTEPIWLLTLSYAGRVFRWSSYPLSITNADGESLHFVGGLATLAVSEGLDLLNVNAEPLSIPLEVVFPGDVDVAQLIQRGHDLSAATAEVALYVPEAAWEDRRVVVAGAVVEPVYGAALEPVSFSVEQNLSDDRARIPSASARVTTSTWASRPVSSEGLYYPIVFGAPGAYVTATGTATVTSGSPAIIVEMTGSNVDTLLIAGHQVQATQVRIWDSDSTGEDFTVSHVEDDLGRVVAVVDITGAGSVDRTSEEWWVGWDNGGGLRNDQEDGARQGAGEVMEWFLRQSTISLDRGRWASAAAELNRYVLAGYVDEPVSPWEWVVDNAFPLLPVTIRSGPEGLYPVIWRRDAKRRDALEHLEVSAGISRLGRVTYTRQPRDVVNEIRLDYAKRARTGDVRRSVTICAEPSDSADEVGSYYAEVSQARYGVGVKVLDTDIVYDEATARLIVQGLLLAEGFAHREVDYQTGREFGWLSPGDVVTLTDAELHWQDQVALVRDLAWRGASLGLGLLVVEDILRDTRTL